MIDMTRKKIKYGIKLNKLYKMRKPKKKMREFKGKINKNKISPLVRGTECRLIEHTSYIRT